MGTNVNSSSVTAKPSSTAMHTVSVFTGKTTIQQDLTQLWTLESIGITDNGSEALTASETQAVKHFESNTIIHNGRYEVSLLFKVNPPALNNNFPQALKCFEALQRRWKRNPSFSTAYHQAMQEYFDKGFAHIVPPHEVNTGNHVFYLPHSAVIRKEAVTTEVRIVFNGSAKFKDTSLNQQLLIGPKLQKNIVDILLRMRTSPIVLAGDVSKMFLQINLSPNDQDVVRFLCENPKSGEVQICKFSTLVFGLTCSPYLANAVIQHLAKNNAQDHPLASKILQNDIYVDDVFIYADTADQAIEQLQDVTKLLEKGGFNLTKFISNCPEVCKRITSDKLNPKALLDLQEDEQKGKTLGVSFHTNTDELIYKIHSMASTWDTSMPETKRSVLSKLASIFDPLGLISPHTILLKICMQNVWKHTNIDWNDTLPPAIQTEWNQAIQSLLSQETLRFPRYIGLPGSQQQAELHIFCDASQKAYATCVYVRYVSNDKVKVTLLMAKERVGPTKALTLPR
ncbi:uncharacterized protein LOC131878188 [Tigriopus californicus]|uniref:uncharacterized protein LOC131878188 n=1 Tax=Tigriopus californicus TaxID=6832 RepID=UPI0027D9D1C4|nr:uncharacterized protein LOC131878188 [Tigriopus californicus]